VANQGIIASMSVGIRGAPGGPGMGMEQDVARPPTVALSLAVQITATRAKK